MAKNNGNVGLREVPAEGNNNLIIRFLNRINPFKRNADNEASSQQGSFDYAINQGAVRSSSYSNENTNTVTRCSDVVARGVDHSKDAKIAAPNPRVNKLVPGVDTSGTQSQTYATKEDIQIDKRRTEKPVAMPTIEEVSVESDSKGIRRKKDVKTADKDFQSKILGIAKGKVSDKFFDELKTALENPEHRKRIKDGFYKSEKDKRKRHNGSRIDI